MEDKPQLIPVIEFCTFHNVEITFISSLEQSGLIHVVKVDDGDFIEQEQLMNLEKFARLYYELDINIEGIETINHLLQRLNEMQEQVQDLRNKLRFYEPL